MAQNALIRLAAIGVLASATGLTALAGAPVESVLRPPGFDLKTWRTEDGLPSDGVNALAQTKDGYLWICTNAGLARFDGARFTVFDRKSTPELQSDQCGPLQVDAEGALWIATMGGGLTRYADGGFTAFGRPQGSTFEYVIAMLPDRKGRLWLGTNDRLHLWDGTRFQSFGPGEGVTVARPMPVLEDASGRVWVQAVDGRLGYFRDGGFHEAGSEDTFVPRQFTGPTRTQPAPDGSLWVTQSNPTRFTHWAHEVATPIDLKLRGPLDAIGRVLPLPGGDAWVGLRESGLRLVRDNAVTEIGADAGLPGGQISAFLYDRERILWVGTSGGLTRIKPRTFSSLDDADGLEVERIWAVLEDRKGDMWFGTDSVLWRLHDGRVRRYGIPEGLPRNGVTSFAEDAEGTLWIGSTGGVSRFVGDRLVTLGTRDGLPSENVRALYADREGRLWIGTAGGLAVLEHGRLRAYTTADGLAGNWVRFIHEDSKGDVWLATTSGLSRLHDGAFTTFTTKDGLADDRVMAIQEEPSGALWFGTYRGGLSRYKDGAFVSVSRARGLHDDTILRILEDDRGYYWMSSPHGIFRVGRVQLNEVADSRVRSLGPIVYDKSDGLPTVDCGGGTQPAGWRARDGRLWFPTGRGVAVVDPARIQPNTEAPPVHIEEVLYDRIHRGGPASATLPAGSKTVEFHYTATLFSKPERARFRYRLEPFDADWVEAGTRRVAYYTALRPGRYRFLVTAANESGVWNATGAGYELRVAPFFYETPAFFAVCVALTALAGWGAYRLRIRQIEARYAAVLSERGRIARELHDTIAQGFTGVSMQLEAASAKLAGVPDDARENLDRARLLVRTSLHDARRSVRALRPLLLESGDLGASLRAVALQLTDGTKVRAAVNDRGKGRRLPPEIEDALFRVGQEAMTNAVRHGGCRSIAVDLNVAKGIASLTVKDDGSGFDPATISGGSGLTGMIERLERLGGTVNINSGQGSGTSVVANVPVRRSRAEESA
jgi:signal transduction histidine kinase/ligand-binding sensor domain-containing protein